MIDYLKAPFPWFGGKSRVAPIVWQRFGKVQNYVEPFFGSGAVLLSKPNTINCTETVNDKDAYVCNFWRAIKNDPDQVAKWADNPVNENDYHARHIWLIQRKETLRSQVEGDPEYFDARIAGYWVYGVCNSIGAHFCNHKGPWILDSNSCLIYQKHSKEGIQRHKLGSLGHPGLKINRSNINIISWFEILSKRFRKVTITSGNWNRLIRPYIFKDRSPSAVFLDPPYTNRANRHKNLYNEDSDSIGDDVFQWAIDNGNKKDMRIALCGYDGEYNIPNDWTEFKWKAIGNYCRDRKDNMDRERIWFSPHCLPEKNVQISLF